MRACLLLAAAANLAAAALSPDYDYAQRSAEDYDESPCLPEVADRCFRDVYQSLQCHVDPGALPGCRQRTVDDFCDAASDAFDCAVAIVDGDCTNVEVFDAWISGLRNVHKTFCTAEKDLLKVLVANPNCWNSISFLTCVEKTIRVNSMVDLMKVPLDLAMCNQIAVAASACNVKATRASVLCDAPQGAVGEAIHAFLTGTSCQLKCSAPAATLPPPAPLVAALVTCLSVVSAFLSCA